MAQALMTRVAGALARPFRPRQKAYPLTGPTKGYIPPYWPWNWWQLGYDPIQTGGGAIVHACVAAYSQTAAMCPPTHWRSTGNGGRERVGNSALQRVLAFPNTYQSGSDFILNLVGSLYEDGNAYALAFRNNRFEVSELHLMEPSACSARIATNGEISYVLAGNPVVDNLIPREMLSAVPAREVLHVKLDARNRNPLVGEPPLTSAMMDIAASNAMVREALEFTKNAARPSGIIYTDEHLEEWQNKEIAVWWDERSRNGGTPILSQGLKWQQVSSTSRDAQLAEKLQISDARIATAYRIPLSLLSLWGAQVQGSAEEQMRFWVGSSFGFLLNHIEDGIGRFFKIAGWPTEYLEFDTAALLRSNQRDRIEALARGVQGGIYSPNEARALEDLPAAKDGAEPRVQQQVVPLSAWSDPPPATPRPDAPAAPPPAGDKPQDSNAKSLIPAYRAGRRFAA